MKKLILQLIIKTIIVAIIISILTYIGYLLSPPINQFNIYEVNGICSAYDKGRSCYIEINNGTTYQITRDLLRKNDVLKVEELSGQNLKFCAVDRIIFSPLIVAWDDNADIREQCIAETNKKHSASRIAFFVITAMFGLVALTPSILRITENRDQIKDIVWRKEKREAEKQRIADKHLDSNIPLKKRPQNMSRKKWKNRNKR